MAILMNEATKRRGEEKRTLCDLTERCRRDVEDPPNFQRIKLLEMDEEDKEKTEAKEGQDFKSLAEGVEGD